MAPLEDYSESFETCCAATSRTAAPPVYLSRNTIHFGVDGYIELDGVDRAVAAAEPLELAPSAPLHDL